MIDLNLSIDQSARLMSLLKLNKIKIFSPAIYSYDLLNKFGDEFDAIFTVQKGLFVRTCDGNQIYWTKFSLIDSFWRTLISKSISHYFNERFEKIQKQVAIKDVKHLVCKAYKLY